MKCTICYERVVPSDFRCPWCGSELPRFCGSCGKPVPAGERACPACGFEPPVAAPLPELTRIPGCPWEDRSRPLLARWWAGWVMSQFNPDLWFRTVPVQGGHGSPFGFFILNQAVYAVANIAATVALMVLVLAIGMGAGVEEIGFMLGVTVGSTIAGFVASVLWLYVASAIYHVSAMIAGSGAGFERTLRVLAFSSAPTIWTAIPYVGFLIALAWSLVLYVFGFRRLHGLTTGRAVVATLMPMSLCIIGCTAWIGLMIAYGF